MIPIRKIEIEINKPTDEIISTLNWHTHPVKNIWIAKTNWFTANSTRPLIGNINNENLSFNLTRLRPFIESFIPQVIVKGQLKNNDNNKTIIIKFLPGLFTTAIYLFIIYMIGFFIWEVISSSAGKDFLVDGIIGFITILLITVLVTIWEINKTKNKIFSIIELKREKPANIL